jgi:hypothetical protein
LSTDLKKSEEQATRSSEEQSRQKEQHCSDLRQSKTRNWGRQATSMVQTDK